MNIKSHEQESFEILQSQIKQVREILGLKFGDSLVESIQKLVNESKKETTPK